MMSVTPRRKRRCRDRDRRERLLSLRRWRNCCSEEPNEGRLTRLLMQYCETVTTTNGFYAKADVRLPSGHTYYAYRKETIADALRTLAVGDVYRQVSIQLRNQI